MRLFRRSEAPRGLHGAFRTGFPCLPGVAGNGFQRVFPMGGRVSSRAAVRCEIMKSAIGWLTDFPWTFHALSRARLDRSLALPIGIKTVKLQAPTVSAG
jgi:hypothetical protein